MLTPSLLAWKMLLMLITVITLLSTITPAQAAQTPTTIPLRITIVFDNTVYDGDLEAAWGFAAIIERGDHTLLFDTGADGAMLLRNMAALGFDPLDIDTIVLSHGHDDHTAGLDRVLADGAAPTVYLLDSFPRTLKTRVAQQATVIEVERGQEVAPGIFTTGALTSGTPDEQALVIPTDEGLIVITGCAHPGIVEIAAAARDLFDDSDQPILLAMGGFHLMNHTTYQLDTIIDDLRDLDVRQIMPTHCTGEDSITHFAEKLGEDYVEGGIGRVIEFEIAVETSPGAETPG